MDWDLEHLKHYVKVSEWFIDWYRNLDGATKRSNLIAVLAKIQAVFEACNYPAGTKVDTIGSYAPLTSKQRYALKRLEDLTAAGHKVVFFAHNPAVLNMFGRLLDDRGISHVLFHGGQTITKRVKDMDKRFREGNAQVLLGSLGCLQTGYNIWQADRAIFYNRSWTPKVEWQAAARLLRPQQTKAVLIEHLELEGSIDLYMRQMVEFKAETCKAGLDYGEDTLDVKDFLHIEAILDQFVKDFEGKFGVKLKEMIAA